MSREVTYVMTTYQRPERLLRAIRFYNGSGIRLIVCDGSAKSMALEVAVIADRNVEYYHRPGESPKERIFFGLSKVTTEFVKWLTDDDFFFTAGVERCVHFLRSAPDYIGAWGVVLGYERIEEKNRYFLTEPYCLDFVCEGMTPFDRVLSFWRRASYDLQHGVFRTDGYRRCLEVSFNTEELGGAANFNLHERIQLSCLPASGKLKFLNVPFGLRESRPTTMGGQSKFLLEILQDQTNEGLIQRFVQEVDQFCRAFDVASTSSDMDVRKLVIQAILDWETIGLSQYWHQPTIFTTTWSGLDGEPRFLFGADVDSRFDIYRASFLTEISRADFLVRAVEEPNEPHVRQLDLEFERVRGTLTGAERGKELEILFEKNPFHLGVAEAFVEYVASKWPPKEHELTKDWLKVLRMNSGGLSTLGSR